MITPDAVYGILGSVMDPEIPVISVVDLGIVRQVTVNGAQVAITITPTYSGCPAMREMQRDMSVALGEHGINDVAFSTVFAPAWTTDWISAEAPGVVPGIPLIDSPVHDGTSSSVLAVRHFRRGEVAGSWVQAHVHGHGRWIWWYDDPVRS